MRSLEFNRQTPIKQSTFKNYTAMIRESQNSVSGTTLSACSQERKGVGYGVNTLYLYPKGISELSSKKLGEENGSSVEIWDILHFEDVPTLARLLDSFRQSV